MTIRLYIADRLGGSITASSEVSRVEVDGVSDSSAAHDTRLQPEFDSRIQGGVLADGIAGFLSGLFTVTPMRWVEIEIEIPRSPL
jgi:xanthine/uracil permease